MSLFFCLAQAGYDKAWTKFLDNVLAAVVRHVDFGVVKCLVIAGPGFAKDAFKAYLEAEAVRRDLRQLLENKCVMRVGIGRCGEEQCVAGRAGQDGGRRTCSGCWRTSG